MPWTVTVPASVIVVILVIALYAVIAGAVKRGRTNREFARLDHQEVAIRWLDTIGPLDIYEQGILLKLTMMTISRNGGATYEDMLGNVAIVRRYVREHPPEDHLSAANEPLDSESEVPDGDFVTSEPGWEPSTPRH